MTYLHELSRQLEVDQTCSEMTRRCRPGQWKPVIIVMPKLLVGGDDCCKNINILSKLLVSIKYLFLPNMLLFIWIHEWLQINGTDFI